MTDAGGSAGCICSQFDLSHDNVRPEPNKLAASLYAFESSHSEINLRKKNTPDKTGSWDLITARCRATHGHASKSRECSFSASRKPAISEECRKVQCLLLQAYQAMPGKSFKDPGATHRCVVTAKVNGEIRFFRCRSHQAKTDNELATLNRHQYSLSLSAPYSSSPPHLTMAIISQTKTICID